MSARRASPEPGPTPRGVTEAMAVGADDGLDPAWPPRLALAAASRRLRREDAWLGWELARSIPPATDPDGTLRRGVAWLGALLSSTLGEGSTRLSLDEGQLTARAKDLEAGTPDVAAIVATAVALRGGTAPMDAEGRAALAELVGEARTHPLRRVGPAKDQLGTARTVDLETRLARALRARLDASKAPPSASAVDRALAEVAESPPVTAGGPIRLSPEQRSAVAAALTRRLAVITGGPGSGKTSVVVSILRTAARLDADAPLGVALAAPTGRAADRMRRSVGAALGQVPRPGFADLALLRDPPPASTLHRLLGFDPEAGRARRHAGAPLNVGLVIVDESSMADVELATALLDALPPAAGLVLLGDADQLPSVEGGAVLRDLVAALEVDRAADRNEVGALVRLTRSYRMDPSDPAGRHVLSVARRVREGDSASTPVEPGHGAGAKIDPSPIRWLEASAPHPAPGVTGREVRDRAQRAKVLDDWSEAVGGPYARRQDDAAFRFPEGVREASLAARLEALFREREAHQVLALSRAAGALVGVDDLNAWFAARRASAAPEIGSRGDGVLPLRIGEPVLAVRNDYERRVWNGDPGLVVTWPRGNGAEGLAIVFPGAISATPETLPAHVHPLSQVRSLVERAYAITVHRAQGGEHEGVALLLPEPGRGERLATRELVYTALTRARRHATVLGSPTALDEAVRRRVERLTGLQEWLEAPGGSS